MTIAEYQAEAMKFNDGLAKDRLASAIERKGISKSELIEGALGLSGETGEVVDIIKKSVFQGHSLDILGLVEEIGDVRWYIALLCNAMGVNLEDVLVFNVSKLNRRYCGGFSEQASINRDKA